ncbi:globin [Paenibacillus hemerocallicola]|jgi:hemoglobin|uniref:Globin n=1 Tax=Paenibacillus hemerocallicola TaxID=1172614 RepID=A0A5C4T6D9_9BACL|nr:globin [Paenibacillus hemerocallicola]TNJ64654.1 globin [Paenibacillus hemerocallicola]
MDGQKNGSNSLYEAIGGADTVSRLVQAFYPKVQADPSIGPLFPEDIDPVMEKQTLFLTQFFGGPPLYSDRYGHPMMRARHLPFPITPERAEAWLSCMKRALAEVGLDQQLQYAVLERLKGPAHHFVNTDE